MTNEELKKYFDLKPCPNSPHTFEVFNMLGEWQIAKDRWSRLVGDKLQTLHFSVSTTESIAGYKIHSLVIWRLKITIGFI